MSAMSRPHRVRLLPISDDNAASFSMVGAHAPYEMEVVRDPFRVRANRRTDARHGDSTPTWIGLMLLPKKITTVGNFFALQRPM
jgi:hypothetical protein